MEFGHGVGEEGLIDFVEVSGGGIEEAGGGDIVDLPWDAAGVIMDEGLGFGLEDLLSHKVDLILKGGITNRPRLFQAMTRDVVYVEA